MHNIYVSETSSSRTPQQAGTFTVLKSALLIVLAASLAACSKPAERAADARPVRAVTVSPGLADGALELAGEVRPRIESRLGFRVGGKIISRKVELGNVVKKNQLLMQLDPQDQALAQTQARAALVAAESNRDLAKAEWKRYQDLRAKNFVATSVLDAKEVAFKSAQSSYEQALAAFQNQSNQTAYTSLLSDVDGVVTGVDAEVGQVVATGTPVIRVAKSGDMDVVVGIPENRINEIRAMHDIKVKLWANEGQLINGSLRELSPIADPVTRTFLAKVSLPADFKDVRLGMTATVSFSEPNPKQVYRLPATALRQDKGVNAVWLVKDGKVQLQPVVLASSSGDDILIAQGVSSGQVVVTAGVHQLVPGQAVTILGQEKTAQLQGKGAPQ